LDAADEELRAADTAGAMRLQEEVGVVNSSFSKQLAAEIATKDGQIANLWSEIGKKAGTGSWYNKADCCELPGHPHLHLYARNLKCCKAALHGLS
jgi:hypothetical protein